MSDFDDMKELVDNRIAELEAEVEALRELLYAEGWGDTSIDKALEAGNDDI